VSPDPDDPDATSGGISADADPEAGGPGPLEPAPAAAPHADDGLDLARAVTRATTSSTPATPRRRPRGKRDDSRLPRGPVTGAHPDERDPQPLDTTLGRLVADHGWELDLRVHGVFARWPELVGPEVAAHTTPESFADGRLVVRTDSTAWATQLRLLAPTVVRRLNEDLGPDTVTVIDVLGSHLPSWKKGPRSVRDGRGPRDTYG
jgi:predicted nucleic acid-binding Zn ribbon protein